MATDKVSATIDRDVLEEIRKRVGPRGVSQFLNDAARLKLQQARIREYLEEIYAEHGAPDAATRARAARIIRGVLAESA